MPEFYTQRHPFGQFEKFVKRLIPTSVSKLLRPLWRFFLVLYNSVPNVVFILSPPELYGCTYLQRVALAWKIDRIRRWVQCPHSEDQIVRFYNEILQLPENLKGCIVEAGCFKGGSSAKFSWLAKHTGRVLHIFDSFQGLPENQEAHGFRMFDGFTTARLLSTRIDQTFPNRKSYLLAADRIRLDRPYLLRSNPRWT